MTKTIAALALLAAIGAAAAKQAPEVKRYLKVRAM
jgi:uncharacterized protein DUF6893